MSKVRRKMSKVLMCDPPSGWKYGFPKPVHEEYYVLGDDFNMKHWLVSEGYPQTEIDNYGEYFYCRYYKMEIDDEHGSYDMGDSYIWNEGVKWW